LPNQLPEALIKSLCRFDHFNPQAFQSIHNEGEDLVSIHFNPEKSIRQNEELPAGFADPSLMLSEKVPWAADAWYLKTRPSFTLDPLFHAGVYYVQEASGMFVTFALKKIADLTKKLKILDLCAAPGGKSTLIQSLISPDSILLSNEVIKTRVPVLHQNMTKWGRANGFISNNDPAQFRQLPDYFDVIVVDAPCSGSGLFRKDPGAVNGWSPELVKLCNQRQKRILADAWDGLKENGFLIYCTCSYSKEENEDILDYLFETFACSSISLSPDPQWKIVETNADRSGAHGYRFYPDKLKGEGFFLSVIQKKEFAAVNLKSKHQQRASRHKEHFEGLNKTEKKLMSQWIPDQKFQYFPAGEGIHALLPSMTDDFITLKNLLYLKKAGIRIGKPGTGDWIPDHELALADILSDQYIRMELEKSDALRYLRGESFNGGTGKKGWHRVCYQQKGLGWVKMLDSRMNNYYPKSWRIRL
jgi:16S rRNA C967 or C1407 C5-methylase (RsmB/RsmF family)/NOL1/NOP2/fmu family ribosome biogenesis protein